MSNIICKTPPRSEDYAKEMDFWRATAEWASKHWQGPPDRETARVNKLVAQILPGHPF